MPVRERAHGGRPPPGLVDLSAPQNPLGPPSWALEAAREALRGLTRYPDYEYQGLREAISRLVGAPPDLIVPLNGSAEALYLLVLALHPKRLVTVEPTFGDHRLLAEAIGLEWVPVYWAPGGDPPINEYCRHAGKPGSLGLVSNPDNPHGGMMPPRLIEEMAECTGGLLLVDEAFIRLSDRPDWSLQASPPEGVAVSGSLTKDLAVPGVRLGYLVVPSPRLASILDSARQPWNVNVVAVTIGVEAGRDPGRFHTFMEESRREAQSRRGHLEALLSRAGLRVYPSMAPYLLVEGPRELHGCLAKRGFYARDASSFHGLRKGMVRVSLPPRGTAERLASVAGGCVGV